MRTRSRGAVSPPPSSPPMAARRKRDSGICMDDGPEDTLKFVSASSNNQSSRDNVSATQEPVTPSKRVKRVRFSDPGPPVQSPVDSPDPLSTGLTPHINRITLSPRYVSSPKRCRPALKRRASLPATLTYSHGGFAVEELQFTPLRQTLNPRVKRRLRRSHLSEEINDIETSWRDDGRARRELSKLRDDSQQKEDRIKELMLEVESQRQLGIEVNQEEEERVQSLQRELTELRKAVDEKQEEVNSVGAATETDYGTSFGFDEAPHSDYGSPSEEMFPGSPCRILESLEPIPPNTVDAGTQAYILNLNTQARLDSYKAETERLKRESCDAKAALDLVKTELRNLGFASDTAGIEDVLASISDAFRKARLDLEYILPGETTTGFENSALLPALVEHVRILLQKQEDSESALGRQELSESVLRGQFNKTLERVDDIEKKRTALVSLVERKETLVRDLKLAADAREAIMAGKDATIVDLQQLVESKNDQLSMDVKRIGEMEEEIVELNTKTERLQTALESYRKEIASLESLVVRMDEDKDKEIAEFQKQLQQSLATQARNIELTANQQKAMEDLVNRQ